MRAILILATALSLTAVERKAVVPAVGAKPAGPYNPGILAGDFLYVSGQGTRTPEGATPATFEEHARQCLENVKAVVDAAGLTMQHVVYSQVYLSDMGNYEAMNRVWAKYFPTNPPARATLGVARMPTDIPIQINAVGVRDLAKRKTVNDPNFKMPVPISLATIAGDRIFISGMLGRDRNGAVPADPAAQVEAAIASFQRALKLAGADLAHTVFTNVYLDGSLSIGRMNDVYRKYFEFGNTPARATIQVSGVPLGAHVEITGVAVRDLAERRSVRPKNMSPSPTASPCVFVADTLYCSAKSAFIPGPNSGIYFPDVETQVRQTMRNLLDGLEEAGLDFSHVVASTVYLDNVDEFPNMNSTYKLFFGATPPTRSTVQPLKPVERRRGEDGRWPMVEQISVIAVR